MALSIGKASSILLRTLPYVLLRMLVYFAFGVAFTIYWVLVFFLGKAATLLHPYVGVGVWIVALILPFPIIRFFREYILYVIKAGHVAVIARLAIHDSLPEGVNQIQWGKEQVQRRFKETSVLFVVDRLVNGVIRSINGMMQGMGNIFSAIPGVGGLVKFAQLILRFSLTYVDEAVLARNFVYEQETVWQSAKTGLVLYAQSWKEILKTAVMLGVLALTSYAVFAIALLIPALGLAKAYPTLKAVWIIGALIFAGVIKLALFDPFALTNMILVYLEATRGQTPDPAWEEKLEAVSKKFRQIKEKALVEGTPGTA